MGIILLMTLIGALVGLGLAGFGVKLYANDVGFMSLLVGTPSILAGLFLIYIFVTHVLSVFYPATYLSWSVMFDRSVEYGRYPSKLEPLKASPDGVFSDLPQLPCQTKRLTIDATASDFLHSLSGEGQADVFEVHCNHEVVARFANISDETSYRVEYWPVDNKVSAIQKLALEPPATVVRGRFISQVIGVSGDRVIISHNSGRTADQLISFDLLTQKITRLKFTGTNKIVGELGSEISVFGVTQNASLIFYKSKYWSGDIAAFNHIAIVSDKHPEGTMIVSLSVKFGSVVGMVRDAGKLYFEVKDRMSGVSRPSYWMLDIAHYL